MDGLVFVSETVTRYAEIEKRHLHGNSVLKTQLQNSMVTLYTLILKYLLRARQYFSKSTPGKVD